ncbi:MAG: DUF4291 domain-containing protein [Armatimonadetes bacterium]|nr:DUF4291 domain-containing protein [Armatimonadota bacterium]
MKHELSNTPENPRRVLAHHDAETVTVYQAFNRDIVANAVAKGTFGAGFGMNRMTWIKASFGWMLHRSSYATAHNQEAIIRVRLSRAGFDAVLEEAVLTHYPPDVYPSELQWTNALARSRVRCQWDPDRNLRDGKLERRAIQLGISGDFVARYVDEWIVGVEDVTALAHEIRDAVRTGYAELPAVPEETHYPVSQSVRHDLGCV